MERFAKLFEVEGFGQVLAKLDSGDKGEPRLSWSVIPPGLGVCEFGIGFDDTDDGWDTAEKALADATEANAKEFAALICNQARISHETQISR